MDDLHQIDTHHKEMLERIIKAGFVGTKDQKYSDRLVSLFRYIHEYFQIVKHLTLDDLPVFKL